ncbi:uncharacterized protein LOC127864923 [Dreissena polymorpha]|uniref:uncharacterized protein LOC127864923 n=1 Tax=Dreissena polymorpha TaxID=45954 RepID=UPI00226541D5|nr:uncharacterized protein LOC127864923 [Dreissena polymorpha]
MATAVLHKPIQKADETTGTWSAIFPTEQVTEVQSALFVKKLLAVAVSNIAYLRAIFPENAFRDRSLEGLNLKILKEDKSCPGAIQVIKWIQGCFDAFDKKYLRMLMIGLYVDPKNPDTVIESYMFKFSYEKAGGMEIYRNNEKISGAHSDTEIRKATIRMLRSIILLTQTLDSLPDDIMMTMKLLYYEDVTPEDYEPPGFKAADNDNFAFEDEPLSIKVGDVNTGATQLNDLRVDSHTSYEHSSSVSEFQNCMADVLRSDLLQKIQTSCNFKVRMKTNKEQFELRNTQPDQQELELMASQSNEIKTGLDNDGATELKETSQESSSMTKQLRHRLKEPLMNADIPMESPAKPVEKAVDIVVSEASQVSESEEFKVRCPCGCNEDDGLMIACGECKFWQHAICFLVMEEDEAPECHVCDVCAKDMEEGKKVTDPYLTKLSSLQVQATCLWRRTLLACLDLDRVLAPTLATRLGVEVTVGQGLVNRLNKEGYLKPPTKPKKLGRVVDKEKITSEAIPKYLRQPEKSDLSARKADEQQECESVKSVPRQHIEVEMLTEKTESLKLQNDRKGNKLSRSKKAARNAQSEVVPKGLDGHDVIVSSIGTHSKWNRDKSRKRAFPKNNEDEEFEISSTQDEYRAAPGKKKKSSVPTKAIMV